VLRWVEGVRAGMGAQDMSLSCRNERRAIQPALQRTMAKRLQRGVVEVAASHVAMLSHPQEVGR